MTEHTIRPSAESASSAPRFAFLYEAALAFAETLNSREVLQRLMNLTLRSFHMDAVSVAQVQSDGSLIFRAASGSAAQRVLGLRIPPGAGIVGWVAQHGEALWVPDVSRDPRFYRQVDAETGFVTQSIYAVPVRVGERTLAVVEMINLDDDLPMEEIAEVMTVLASLAAPAIQNATLFEQVSEAEARYQRLFKENIAPLVILDAKGNLLDANLAAIELLGLKEQDFGQQVLHHLRITPIQFTHYRHLLQYRETLSWEMALHGKQRLHYFDIQLTAIPYGEQTTAYQWMAHDITARVELDEMRQQLSRMIVHDLRNPLNTIISSMEFIQTSWQEGEEGIPIVHLLTVALRSAHRMDNLIQDILDTARLEAGERPLLLHEVDLQRLLKEIQESLQPALHHRRQHLQIEIPSPAPSLHADEDLLRRILLNLLDNAIKFTPSGGRITLQISDEERGFVRFIVRDTGRGITENEQANIFKLYRRGRNSRTTRGTGIGLAFCKLAVEAHGGQIWLEKSDIHGSTFVFTLPRHDREGERA